MGKMRVIPSPCPGSLKDLEFFRQHEISEKNMQCNIQWTVSRKKYDMLSYCNIGVALGLHIHNDPRTSLLVLHP